MAAILLLLLFRLETEVLRPLVGADGVGGHAGRQGGLVEVADVELREVVLHNLAPRRALRGLAQRAGAGEAQAVPGAGAPDDEALQRLAVEDGLEGEHGRA